MFNLKLLFLLPLILLMSCDILQENKPVPKNYTTIYYQPIPNATLSYNTTNSTNTTNITISEPILVPIKDKLAVYVLETSKKGTSLITLNNKSVLINAQGGLDGLRTLKAIKNIGIKKLDYLILTNEI